MPITITTSTTSIPTTSDLDTAVEYAWRVAANSGDAVTVTDSGGIVVQVGWTPADLDDNLLRHLISDDGQRDVRAMATYPSDADRVVRYADLLLHTPETAYLGKSRHGKEVDRSTTIDSLRIELCQALSSIRYPRQG